MLKGLGSDAHGMTRRSLTRKAGIVLGAAVMSIVDPVRPAAAREIFVPTSGEHSIPLRRWRSFGGCTIVGLHAFGDYSEAFGELARSINRYGHDVFAFDQRGFGRSEPRGVYAGDEAYRDDLASIIAYARRMGSPGAPIIVIGESFGGSVALSTLAERPALADALILSGPGVREDLPAKGLWDGMIDAAASLFGSRSITLDQDNERLSPIARRRMADDPLILRQLRADTYERVVEMADRASVAASAITVPTLVLYGEQDGIIHRKSIDALVRRLGRHGRLHLYKDGPHLMLQAASRQAMEADLSAFIKSIMANRSRG
jgi:acylglycerol lipase